MCVLLISVFQGVVWYSLVLVGIDMQLLDRKCSFLWNSMNLESISALLSRYCNEIVFL